MNLDLYKDKFVHIFTNNVNSLYILNTQMKHPFLYNNHLDKTILFEMIPMLQQRTFILTIYKVRVHYNITGNDKANELAKAGHENKHRLSILPYEDAHSIPYFLHKDFWIGNMSHTPYTSSIQHLQKHLIKHNNIFLLEYLKDEFPYISKWTNDPNINNEHFIKFWTNPQIIEPQIKQLLKFRTQQYMDNVRKKFF